MSESTRMARKERRGTGGSEPKERPAAPADAAAVITPRSLAKLCLLGALSGLWSLFLWAELVLVRSGGSSFCGFGGKLDCEAIWTGAFASTVHRFTGLPIAGWGLAWSAAAFLLPLAALLRRAEAKNPVPLGTGVRFVGLAGILSVALMIAASAIAGSFCLGCVVTYVVVGAYGFISLLQWRPAGFPLAFRGFLLAAGAFGAAFLLLLYPGLHTPKSSGEAGRKAVSEAVAQAGSGSLSAGGTGNAQSDKILADLIASLEPPLKQTFADSLAIYRAAQPQRVRPPRALVGSDLAPVRITEFTDILCEHCAGLQETLQTLRESSPPGSFSVDARQFPLDGRCNPFVGQTKGDDVRCAAAKARICMEPTGKEPQFAAALFAAQKGLTRGKVFEIAAPFMPRPALTACMDSAATRAKLEEDITAAGTFDSDGTPIVAINGRKGTSFGPFLYAMILTRGNPEHPAFEALPPGDPTAHLH
jgi:serine/threonine-protein kinase